MADSLKFGPEWLNKLTSSQLSMQKEAANSYILSDKKMLAIYEASSRKLPEILPLYKRLFVENHQTPLGLQCEDEKTSNNSGHRLFLNSNIKHGFNYWRRNNNSKDESEENWRLPSNKETSFSSSIMRSNVRKSWREKPSEMSPRTKYELNCNKEKEVVAHKAIEITSPELLVKHEINKQQISSKKDEENGCEVVGQYANACATNSSNFEDKSLIDILEEAKRKRQKEEKEKKAQQKQADTSDCELNLQKLEKDLLLNLSDLTIDDEKKSPDNKQVITWFYIDPNGTMQGPFKEGEMSVWYECGFFYDNLMVRRSIDNNFISLKHLIQAFGHYQPFYIAQQGFPIPAKLDDHLENIQQQHQNAFNVPQKVSNLNNQWMSYPEPNIQYHQQNIQQYPQNVHQQPYSFVQNCQAPPNIPLQIDPRLYMNPYVPIFNANSNNLGINTSHPMFNAQVNMMKNQMCISPMANQFTQSSLVQHMQSIIPTNPIQKLLFELQKQKDMERQRQAMLYQQNMAAINENRLAMGDRMMQQYSNVKKVENNQKIQQQNVQCSQNNNNQCVEEKYADADEEGEFKFVGNVKRKKFHKEIKDKQEKVKEVHNQFYRPSNVAPRFGNPYANGSNNKESVMNNRKTPEEKVKKISSTSAPWKKQPGNAQVGGENLLKIQIQEEEIRQIQKQLEREKEIESARKEEEMKKRAKNLSWNTVMVENDHKDLASGGTMDYIWGDAGEVNENSNKNVDKKTARIQSKNRQNQQQESRNALKEEKENEFKNWSIETVAKMNATIDIPVFVNFLMTLESPYDIEDYVKMYLGDSIDSTLFTRKFLERRSSFKNSSKVVEIDDDLCAPPKAINPGENDGNHHKSSNRKKNHNNKKNKKSMKFADINILGFKATAASNRIVGELHEGEY